MTMVLAVSSSSPYSLSSSWTCHACTFINHNSNGLACGICLTARDGNLCYSINETTTEKKFISTLDLPLPPRKPKKKKSTKSVTFGTIQVREYERLIDVTSCLVGLSLGWKYLVHDDCASINNHKNSTTMSSSSNSMKKSNVGRGAGDGSGVSQKRTWNQRCKILLRYGYTHPQIEKATARYNSLLSQKQQQQHPAASAICISKRDGATTLLPSASKKSSKSSKIEKMMFRFF